MKTINKKNLDELIRVCRKYAKTGDTDILPCEFQLAEKISHETMGSRLCWAHFDHVVNACCGNSPLITECTNDEVYRVFEAMGFSVSERSTTMDEVEANKTV